MSSDESNGYIKQKRRRKEFPSDAVEKRIKEPELKVKLHKEKKQTCKENYKYKRSGFPG